MGLCACVLGWTSKSGANTVTCHCHSHWLNEEKIENDVMELCLLIYILDIGYAWL